MSRSKLVKIRYLRYIGHLCINFHNPFGNLSCFQAAEFIINREQNGRSPTRICELVRRRASTQVYALVRIIECQKKKKKKKKKKKMQLVLSNINF